MNMKNLFKFLNNSVIIKISYILTTLFLIRLSFLEENQILKIIETIITLNNLVLTFKNVVVIEDVSTCDLD